MKRNRKLTFIEAIALVMGSGIGGGIMAVPFLASLSGILPFLLILVLALIVNILIHLMLVEVCFRDGSQSQLVEMIRRYVFTGSRGRLLLQGLFILLYFSFLANLSAYITGGGEIISQLTGLPGIISLFLVYLISAGVAFFGLKIVGICEKYAVFGIILILVIIFFGTRDIPFRLDRFLFFKPKASLALYGMLMYSLYSFFAVPQTVKGVHPGKKSAVLAVVIGLSLNAGIILFITLQALGVSSEVTEIAIVGIGRAAGILVSRAGSLLILLAMLTSFWSISLALSDIIRERLNIKPSLSWLLASLPPLLLSLTGYFSFLEYLKLAGGIVALILVTVTVPMYRRSLTCGRTEAPGWSLGRFAHPGILIIILIMILFMAVGSLITI